MPSSRPEGVAGGILEQRDSSVRKCSYHPDVRVALDGHRDFHQHGRLCFRVCVEEALPRKGRRYGRRLIRGTPASYPTELRSRKGDRLLRRRGNVDPDRLEGLCESTCRVGIRFFWAKDPRIEWLIAQRAIARRAVGHDKGSPEQQ
jgi:hypothetical protein